jgi:UDP-N-acetylmuramate--alanine ligase
MIAFNNIQSVYFLGIGGIGMSAIARYFNAKGIQVSGYDKTPSELTNTLIAEGIAIHFEDSIDLLNPKADLVIYTPAIPKDHQQMNWYLNKGFTLYKRAQVLGMISKESFCIAVAGSHGKTTVSSMIAHILHENGGCTAFLGGIATNFQSNYIQSSNKYVVVEADEYDRSFLTLSPNIAVITAIDSDHLEIYGSLENIENEFIHFAQKIEENGTLILQENYQHIENRLPKSLQVFHYGQNPQSDFYLKKYSVNEGVFTFSIQTKDSELTDCKAHFGGIHNLENATAAAAVCKTLGLSNEAIQKSLLSFKGIKRRFEKHVDNNFCVYIDDYAHHPQEIKALLDSITFLYPEKEILAIFQPHLFSRTQDLCAEFGQELYKAHEVIFAAHLSCQRITC